MLFANLLALLLISDAGDLRLNQIQVIGTHNSYHIAPTPEQLAHLNLIRPGLGDGLDYSHRPLAEQFSELGIRQIELDLFADPEGGLYATPRIRDLFKAKGKEPGPDPNATGVMSTPGFKVLHVPDLDYQSTVSTLENALNQIHAWSHANPRHLPIFVLLELKEDRIPGLSMPAPFDATALDQLDSAIRNVFEQPALYTPDDLRGSSETLPAAIAERGWPKLDDVRGRVIFALDNEGEMAERYLDGHPALRERVMFVSVKPEQPAAAWMKVNDAVRDFERIQNLVRRGFLVRTRADSDTKQSRANDTTTRDKALASGAQFVSTDYPVADMRFSPYVTRLEGEVVARLNPISGAGLDARGDLEGRLREDRP
jgi:Phosphoinositide phospholipase C, Ca2+-dependent